MRGHRHLFRLLIVFSIASGCDSCCGSSSKTSSSSSASSSGGCAGDDEGGCGGATACAEDSDCNAGLGEVCCEGRRGLFSPPRQCLQASECNRRASFGDACVDDPSHASDYPLSAPYPCEVGLDCLDRICQCPLASRCDRPCGPQVDACRTRECCRGDQICRPPPHGDTCVDTFPTLVAATSSAFDERDPTLTPDGALLVFVRTPNAASTPGAAADGELWSTQRHGERWLPPRKLAISASGARDLAPSLGPQGLTLYFASDRAASGQGRGGLDIWRARRNASGHDFAALAHIAQLSSACDDLPRLTPDGRHIVVLRRCGRAAREVLVAPAKDKLDWGALVPLDPWLDTSGIESLWISSDLRVLIVAARDDAGGRALYRLDRAQPGERFGPRRTLLTGATALGDPWASVEERWIKLVYAEQVIVGGSTSQWELAQRLLRR